LAEELTSLESKVSRKQKKQNVVILKRSLLKEAFPELTDGLSLEGDVNKILSGEWPKDKAIEYIIDLAFTNPFAPHELRFKNSHFKKALNNVAALVHLSTEGVDRILRTKQDAFKASRHINWKKIAMYGVPGIVVFAAGGWVMAPALGAAIGMSAGLYGAAATSHGLAILGGGSLAIGGWGMAGGMAVVTGISAVTGGALLGGSQVLLQLGAANARVELAKLQVSYKEMILGGQLQIKKAQEILNKLVKQHDEVKQLLDKERELNDKNSARIKDMEATLRAVEDSLKWMKKEAA
jgi:hypothetical protein